jgi:hypothetical protein
MIVAEQAFDSTIFLDAGGRVNHTGRVDSRLRGLLQRLSYLKRRRSNHTECPEVVKQSKQESATIAEKLFTRMQN